MGDKGNLSVTISIKNQEEVNKLLTCLSETMENISRLKKLIEEISFQAGVERLKT